MARDLERLPAVSVRSVSTVLRVAILATLIAGMAILARTTELGAVLDDATRSLGDMADRPWAPFAYIALYAVCITFGLPGTLVTLIGGVAFGLSKGFLINMTGAVLGSAGAFLLARTVGREVVTRLLGKHLARLDGLEDRRTTFMTTLRLRLMPIVPFNMVNFAAGLTKAKLRPFLAGTALGIVPSTFLFTYFATALVAGGQARADAVVPLTVALGGMLLLGLLPSIVKFVKRRV